MFKPFHRLYKPFIFFTQIFLLFIITSSGQQVTWGFNVGASAVDNSQRSFIDLAGNVYTCGEFRGNNVDFDPSPATALHTSNGQSDGFMAKYSSTGQYIMSITIGGSNLDKINGVGTDLAGNIYVVGYFRGANVDFDPSPATAFLTSNGDAGGDPGYGGDIFVAKYSPTGQYLWAFNVGATSLGDNAIAVACDPTGNVFVGGYFRGSPDFDPGPSTAILNASNATGFLAKYNSAGAYQWAFNFGQGDVDNAVFDIKLDAVSNVYMTGYFQGTNIDFDPSAGTAILNAVGNFEGFLAKYTSAGQYQFAFRFGGFGIDVGRGLSLDNAGNIYVTGDFNGTSIDFDPSAATALLSSNGASDIFLGKYTNTGQYIWAFNAGSSGGEISWDVVTDNTSVYITGGFSGIADFNPSATTDNLTSNGGADIFLAKYSAAGLYECAFNIGSGQDDNGVDIQIGGNNIFYLSGGFYGSNVDFTPTTSTFLLSSNGSMDAFLVKYYWPPNTLPTGTVVGSTICPGQPAQLTFNSLTGTSPFTLIYSDGTNSYTQTNVQSGVPFNLQVNPTVTTTYTITLIQDAVRCSPQNTSPGITATAVINNNCGSSIIVNDYTPVLSLDPCKNIIDVGDASAFNVGDTVLLIQMKGAVIDSSNTSSFGNITNYKNAGNYEFNYVKSKNGNSIELLNEIERQYDLPDGKMQIIRVPYFQNYTVTTQVTCPPWDGQKGGVIVFNVANTLTLNEDINADGKGFRGGNDPFSNPSSLFCYENQFYYPPNPDLASEKGEGIALVSAQKSFGKGAVANGGGGGNSHNSGGGGGGNSGGGGFGGYNYESTPCNTNVPFDNRGIGGKPLTVTSSNKIFLGGGGGAGQSNNPEAFQAKGGNGGGIVIIKSNVIVGNSKIISAIGDNGVPCSGLGATGCHEGMGGAGGGGTILIQANTYTGGLSLNSIGGKGGDMIVGGAGRLGPGGGGGGGVVWLNTSAVPSGITILNFGARGGVNTGYSNDPWGTTAGQNGQTLFNLNLPFSNTIFKPNIDSVRIKDSLKTCADFDFKGLAYTNANPIATWQWYFGDGGTASTQNTSHSYAPGNFTAKLVVTDINGCKDSITRNVIASTLTVNAGNDTTICSGQSVTLQATTNGGTQFQWNNSSLLNNSTILNPVATPLSGLTPFIITASNAAGCSRFDTVNILVRSQSTFSINAPSPICPNGSAQLLAQGGDTYQWSPSSGINSTIPNPVVNASITTTYTVQITDTVCNQTQNLSTQVVVLQLPNVQAFKQNDIDCMQVSARLNATGAMNYKWLPSTSLNNPNISNPTATPTATTTFTVEGTDAAGCKDIDTITVVVDFSVKNGLFLVPNAFTPNNDGLNDCFGIKHWGVLEDVEFSIYNRWGELIFHTTDASKCWDGTWKNLKQDPGVFVYWIRAKSLCGGNVFRKGTVLLIR